MDIEFKCKLSEFIDELITRNEIPVIKGILNNKPLFESIEWMIKETLRWLNESQMVSVSISNNRIDFSYENHNLSENYLTNKQVSIKLDEKGNFVCDDYYAIFVLNSANETKQIILDCKRIEWNKKGICMLMQKYEDRYDFGEMSDRSYSSIKNITQLFDSKKCEELIFVPVFRKPYFEIEKSLIESSILFYPVQKNNPEIEISYRHRNNPNLIIKESVEALALCDDQAKLKHTLENRSCASIVLETCNVRGHYTETTLAYKRFGSRWIVNYENFPCFSGMELKEIIDVLTEKNLNVITLSFKNTLAKINEKVSQKIKRI